MPMISPKELWENPLKVLNVPDTLMFSTIQLMDVIYPNTLPPGNDNSFRNRLTKKVDKLNADITEATLLGQELSPIGDQLVESLTKVYNALAKLAEASTTHMPDERGN